MTRVTIVRIVKLISLQFQKEPLGITCRQGLALSAHTEKHHLVNSNVLSLFLLQG